MASYIILIIIIISLVVVWSVGTYLYEKHLERPSYSVIKKRRGYELRLYESYIVAETVVSGSYERASNAGFGILAGYIFGNNTRKEKMDMTAPVAIGKKKAQEKISMTAPVVMQQKEENQTETYTMSFMMPSKYTLDTLPNPNNPGIELHRVPERKVAAFRFSLIANVDRIEKKTEELKMALRRDGFDTISEPAIARYNAPFSNPLLRRNEILIEIR
jgi:hypothetical protein